MDRMHDETSIQKIVGKLYLHTLTVFKDTDTTTGAGMFGHWFWVDEKPRSAYLIDGTLKLDPEKLYANMYEYVENHVEHHQLMAGSGYEDVASSDGSVTRYQLTDAYVDKNDTLGVYLRISAMLPKASHHTGLSMNFYFNNSGQFYGFNTSELFH